MRHHLLVQILEGLSRRPPGLSCGATNQRAVDLEPDPIEHGLDVDAAQRIIEKYDDLGLTGQIALEGLSELVPLLLRPLLNLTFASHRAMNVVTAEGHERQCQAILG